MQCNSHFWQLPLGRLNQAVIAAPELNATIRRTATGVRIKFSDGRVAWLDKDDCISESGFIGSVMQWVRRHGVRNTEIEYQ